MWPYLVGIELRDTFHLYEVNSRLHRIDATSVIAGIWLVRSDYELDALFIALRTILDDEERFFVAALDEDFRSQGLPIHHP